MLAGLQAHLKTAPEPDWPTLLARPVNWSHVLELCQHHEVTPFVYESLKPHVPQLSQEARTSFKQQVTQNKKRSLHLARVLQHLLPLFQQERIEVLPHKGVLLSQQLFGDIGARPTKDLDLVVQKKDYWRARDVLLRGGFRGPVTSFGKQATPQQEKLFLGSSHQLVFKGHSTKLELHIEMSQPGLHKPFTVQELWPQLTNHRYETYPIKTLTPEQTLFILASHASLHYWQRLKWLFDSAVLFDQQGMSPALLQQAEKVKTKNILLANAALCHVLLSLPLRPSVGDEVATHPTLQKLVPRVLKQFASWPHDRIRNVEAVQSQLWLKDSLSVRTVQQMLVRQFITGGHHFYSAPAFVYYLTRPVTLTAKYLRQLLK
jgi:hypothetical protein